MSDVDGIYARKENQSVVTVVQIRGKLDADQFDELIAAIQGVSKKYPFLEVKVTSFPKAKALARRPRKKK